jgi:CBS domain-containing protein
MDREEAARELAHYDFLAVPVVDAEGRLLGIVTHDDVMDILESEASEDLEKFGGLIPSDEEKTYLTTPVMSHFRARLPWLVVLLFLSSVSGFQLLYYRELLSGNFILWYGLLITLSPMICATAGKLAHDCRLELGDAVDVSVLSVTLRQSPHGRGLDVLGRVEVGLAGRQRDDVPPGRLELACLGRHCDGRGGLNAIQAVGGEAHGPGFPLVTGAAYAPSQTARTLSFAPHNINTS